jgi:hypothetical protein
MNNLPFKITKPATLIPINKNPEITSNHLLFSKLSWKPIVTNVNPVRLSKINNALNTNDCP